MLSTSATATAGIILMVFIVGTPFRGRLLGESGCYARLNVAALRQTLRVRRTER